MNTHSHISFFKDRKQKNESKVIYQEKIIRFKEEIHIPINKPDGFEPFGFMQRMPLLKFLYFGTL